MTTDLPRLVPPRPVPPRPTAVERVFAAWKEPPLPLSPGLLGRALGAGVLGAIALGDLFANGSFGVNVPIAALAVAAVAFSTAWTAGRVVARGRIDRTGIAFCLLALVLAGTAAVRDAPWIVGLALLLALPLGSYGAVGGRTWTSVLGGGALALPMAAGRMLPWVARGARRLSAERRTSTWPAVRTGLLVAALLAVFGGLFAGADAAFGDLAGSLVPDVSAGPIVLRAVAGALTAVLALALAFLTLAPPPLRILERARPDAAGRWAWAVPIAALDLLFVAFCAVQASVLLAADKDRLLRSTGLTYAEYARRGFFQLVVVTVLVLAVVAFAVRHAPTGTRRDRVLVRALLGLLCALTLVVVAVALRRLYLYEEASGWTRLRLWVHAFELWLGLVVVLVAAAGVRLRARWLPRAVAASGAAGLIALAALNPDAFIAERNVGRFEHTGRLDVQYLRGLSADAVPALDRLPEPQRSCALRAVAERLGGDETRLSANLSRHEARALLDRRPVQNGPAC